jgi:nucleoside-diphosphate-sugar epimerase
MQGYEVRAGVRDIEKAKETLPKSDNLELVLADVTGGADLLGRAIAGSNAVIVATGFRPSFDITASWKVDNIGTKTMVDACQQRGIKRMVLVSSILVNGAAIGQIFNPAYIVLNIFGLTLVAKLQAEKYMRKSGIDYTIIRPGGLKNDPPSGNIVLAKEDTLFGGSVSRDTVAKVAVESLRIPEASFKVVELVSSPDAPPKSIQELFAKLN